MFGMYSVIKVSLSFKFFTPKMDSKKYVEILKNYKSDLGNLHQNGILVLWDNESKHKLEMSLNYKIKKQYTVVRMASI